MGLGGTALAIYRELLLPVNFNPTSVSHGQTNIHLLGQYFIRQKLSLFLCCNWKREGCRVLVNNIFVLKKMCQLAIRERCGCFCYAFPGVRCIYLRLWNPPCCRGNAISFFLGTGILGQLPDVTRSDHFFSLISSYGKSRLIPQNYSTGLSWVNEDLCPTYQ